jgi:hypothetical protein
MKDLLDEDIEPTLEWICLLDRADTLPELKKLERAFIKDLAAAGHPLTNRFHHLGSRRRRFRNRPKYLDGTRLGRLTILEFTPSARCHMYRCQCDCGNIVTLRSVALGRRHPSCGCWGRELLKTQASVNGKLYGGNRDAAYAPGDRVGIWTVIAEHDKQNSKRRYLVRCEHGREQVRSLAGERSQPRKSCGCPRTIREAVYT